MRPARHCPTARVGLLVYFDRTGAVTGFPIVSSDVEQAELARRLRRLAASIVENPTLADYLAGLMAPVGPS
jgi:hypothetical protein